MALLELENLTKVYGGGSPAIAGINLSVAAGERVVIVGESGCGKTTTLKTINRLIEPTSGVVRINGQDTRGRDAVALRRTIGYVFQGIGLFPHMTVAENIGVVPRLLGWSAESIARRVAELLELVRLDPEEYGGRFPAALSGGQGQRVGFARAIAGRPSLLLLDEPFGALDPITRGALQDEFLALQEKLGLTAIFVTHDMAEALLMAQRIVVMRGGRIVQVATPGDLVRAPADDYVKALVDTPARHAARLAALGGAP